MRFCSALACAIGLASTWAVAAASPQILVVSNRADLISGGDALVEIKWPAGTNVASAKIALNNVDIASAFAQRPNGRYMGLVTGLRVGDNVLTVRGGGQRTGQRDRAGKRKGKAHVESSRLSGATSMSAFHPDPA